MTAEKPPLSNQGETSREAVTDRLARLDDYGKLELFSTCHNCAKWQEVLFADNEHCIKPKVAKSPPSRHPFRPGSRSVQLRDSDRSDVLMQEMISVDNSKAAVGLLGKLLQLSYIEQCILLDHIEDGMTIEDLVASLESSASHEAKSIAKRIEAVKQNVIMGINCTKHPGEDAWEPTITAARLLEKAEKALLRDADAYFAQRAAQEALSLLKANEQQIEQLHTLLEQEGSEDDR